MAAQRGGVLVAAEVRSRDQGRPPVTQLSSKQSRRFHLSVTNEWKCGHINYLGHNSACPESGLPETRNRVVPPTGLEPEHQHSEVLWRSCAVFGSRDLVRAISLTATVREA